MVIDEDGYTPIEVKTSSAQNLGVKRQQENSEKVFSYQASVEVEGLFGIQEKMFRESLTSEEQKL